MRKYRYLNLTTGEIIKATSYQEALNYFNSPDDKVMTLQQYRLRRKVHECLRSD